jgi:hypothetical protein
MGILQTMSNEDISNEENSNSNSSDSENNESEKFKLIKKKTKELEIKPIDLILGLRNNKYYLVLQLNTFFIFNKKFKQKFKGVLSGECISAIEFNEKYYITASNTLTVWSSKNFKEKRSFGNGDYFCVSKFGENIMASTDNIIEIYNIKGKLIKKIDVGLYEIYSLVQIKNDILLAGNNGDFGKIKNYKYQIISNIGNCSIIDFKLISKDKIIYISENSVGIYNFKKKKNKF